MRKSENRDSVQDSSIGKAISVLNSPIKLLRYFRKKILIEPRMRKSQERFLKEMLSGNIDDFTQITDEIMNDSVFHRDIKCQFDSVNLPYSATQRYDWSISNYYLISSYYDTIILRRFSLYLPCLSVLLVRSLERTMNEFFFKYVIIWGRSLFKTKSCSDINDVFEYVYVYCQEASNFGKLYGVGYKCVQLCNKISD